jgi:hypothetical protein
MVAKQLRTVLDPHTRCVVASNYPDEGSPENEGGDFRADLPSRLGGIGHPAHTEARAELRDRETYYAELRFAVHCQSRSIPAPRAALDNEGPGAWTHSAAEKSAQENTAPETRATETRATETGGPEGESWDDMIARFGDTWT